jgi:hypothetical protein
MVRILFGFDLKVEIKVTEFSLSHIAQDPRNEKLKQRHLGK